MFNKTKIAAAVAATALGVAGMQVANAVHVNPDGTGEVLVFPYYNTNNNFQTSVSVTNTTSSYKIVKMRFRESGNSQDVLDFNIYMSPYDVWTGTVRQVDGQANLLSTDTTCTFPPNDQEVVGVGILNDGGWNFKAAYPDVDAEDPLEGYIEVFETGNIPATLRADSNKDGVIDKDDALLSAGIKHASGVPANCNVVVDAWLNGVGDKDKNSPVSVDGVPLATAGEVVPFGGGVDRYDWTAQGYLVVPDGGIYGMTIFLDLVNGGAYVADPVAIDNWSSLAQHFRPDDVNGFLLPSLASGDIANSSRLMGAMGGFSGSVDPNGFPYAIIDRDDYFETVYWPRSIDVGLNDGDTHTPRAGTNPGPVAHVLSTKSIANDYFVDPTFDGATDWVVTFPMRKHGIFNGKWTSVCDKDATDSAVGVGTSEAKNACFKDAAKDVSYSVAAYDREEGTRAPSGFQVSPVLESGDGVLPREVNIINFSAGDSVLGSNDAASIDTGTEFAHGWAKITFGSRYTISNAALTANDDGSTSVSTYFFPGEDGDWTSNVHGVPAIGFAAIRGSDGAGSGPTFGETTPHAYER